MTYYGAPGEIRTPGLLVRSQTLYPAELRAHISRGANSYDDTNFRAISQCWRLATRDRKQNSGPPTER
jgi:hypothetical protein